MSLDTYDAKGQRTLVVYANGVMTRYRYDERMFRLTRLVSERYSAQTETSADAEQLLRYLPSGSALQNLAYHHDRVGNILEITDTTPQSGVPNTPDGADRLRRRFDYDSLYRLTSATGREADTPAPAPYWDASPRPGDASVVRFYQERYRYDRAGNLIELKHLANGAGFTRQLPIRGDSNRLERLQIGDLSHAQSYDPNGNLVLDGTSRHFDWDHAERLVSFRTQTDGSSPTLVACYLYDAAGERTKKLVRTNGTLRTTTYVGPHFERHTTTKLGDTPVVRDELRLMDDRRRVSTLRVGPPPDGDTTPATKVHLGDHLDNAVLDLDGYGAVITREELTPYGETSLGGHPSKRYRFTGKERDSESGLSYHSARYYAPWAGRWASCDPSGPVDGPNLYPYARSSPARFRDPAGRQSLFANSVARDQHVFRLNLQYQRDAQPKLDYMTMLLLAVMPAHVAPYINDRSHLIRDPGLRFFSSFPIASVQRSFVFFGRTAATTGTLSTLGTGGVVAAIHLLRVSALLLAARFPNAWMLTTALLGSLAGMAPKTSVPNFVHRRELGSILRQVRFAAGLRHSIRKLLGQREFSLKTLDPSGSIDTWLEHIVRIAQSEPATILRRVNGGTLVEAVGKIPLTGTHSTISLGVRMWRSDAENVWRVTTILTRQ